MLAMGLIIIGSLSLVLVWCCGIRRHLVRSRRVVASGAFFQLMPWSDWRSCAELARSGDTRAAWLCRAFVASLIIVAGGLVLSLAL